MVIGEPLCDAVRFVKAKMLRRSSGGFRADPIPLGIATFTTTHLAEDLFQDRRRRSICAHDGQPDTTFRVTMLVASVDASSPTMTSRLRWL
jgi:hypothetical protein